MFTLRRGFGRGWGGGGGGGLDLPWSHYGNETGIRCRGYETPWLDADLAVFISTILFKMASAHTSPTLGKHQGKR